MPTRSFRTFVILLAATASGPRALSAQGSFEWRSDTVRLETANGEVVTRVFRNAQVSLLGRDTTGMCVELPAGSRPLLGAIPMESMGIEPDLANRTLRLLPDSGPDGYIMA